jgi:hypothetical protein
VSFAALVAPLGGRQTDVFQTLAPPATAASPSFAGHSSEPFFSRVCARAYRFALVALFTGAAYIARATDPIAFHTTGYFMDYDTKLIHARLDAIEAILINLCGRDGETLERIREMLTQEHSIARKKQNTREQPRMQTSVALEMRPPRDFAGEAARTAAYEGLCRKFNASLTD